MTMIRALRHFPVDRSARCRHLAALAAFAATAITGTMAGQSSALPSPVSAVIRAEFPYEATSSPPAKENPSARTQTFPKTAALPAPALQWKDAAPLPSKSPVVSLPGFTVTAQKYPSLGNRLDQIDSSMRREESLATPSRADLILNGDKASNFLQKFLVSFGSETAQKRARDANKRIEVLEMRRIVEVGLLSAAPDDRKRLNEDQAALKDLSAQKLDQAPFSDPRAGAGN